ncbi:hypothetical protein [Paenibacillus sp. MBLB4367]|uniref:hypothetical protein n=1 Tax=Paenibacillus sp. MBLB4367 TaxID=3384767 RepID=UPI003907FEC9
MDPKRMFIASAMAFAITVGTLLCDEEANANNTTVCLDKSGVQGKSKSTAPSAQQAAEEDSLHNVLGVSSEEELYDALYKGRSLADIAYDNDKEVQGVIELQIAELTEQLDKRLTDGSISTDIYQAQIAELNDIVTKSVYGYT